MKILNIEEYKEEVAVAIHPGQLGLKAVHHLDFSSNMIAIDGIFEKDRGQSAG